MGWSPPSREGTPLKGAPIVVCARTSLAVTTRKPAPCVRFSAGAAATQVATLKAAGDAMVPVATTGTRETARARTVTPLPLP
jgi:hypothetical protein